MRAFLAFDLPDEASDALDRLQSRLTVGRPVPSDDFHLTLIFLADASLEALEELNLRLEMLVLPPLALSIRGVDVFGSEAPRSLHVRVEAEPALIALQRKLARAARDAGLALPHRRFVPHVTLARFGRGLSPPEAERIGRFLAAHGDWALPSFVPASLSLYRSTLGQDGARHDLLARYGDSPEPW